MTNNKIVVFLIGLGLMIYLGLRAWFVPLVHDEAATFLHFVSTNKFMPSSSDLDANNHYLNSILTHFFYTLFGSSEFVLRMANLIFFPVYVLFWFKLSEMISNPFIRWVFLLSGLFSQGMIEFFALSRGYGISMGLLVPALYLTIRALNGKRAFYLLPAIVCMLLALLANLALLNLAIMICCLMILFLLFNGKQINRKQTLLAILLCVAGIILYTQRLFAMQEKGSLYYGSGNGFLNVTLRSLMLMLLGTNNVVYEIIIVVFTAITLGVSAYLLIRSKDRINAFFGPEMVFPLLLIGNVIAAVLLNLLFKVNYPEDRVGIYFLPLFTGSICFVTDSFIKEQAVVNIKYFVLPLLIFPLLFVLNVNLSHSSLYYIENIPHRFYDQVASYSKIGEIPPTVGGYRMRELAWDYQNLRHGAKAGVLSYQSHPQLSSDFQVSIADELGDWKLKYDQLDYDKISGLSLFKRKHFLSRRVIWLSQTGKVNTEKEYLDLYRGEIDTVERADLYIEVQLILNAEQKPFRIWLVASVYDKNDKELMYERLPVNWLISDWNSGEFNITSGLQLNKVPLGAYKLVCYLWNMDKIPYSIKNSGFVIDRLIE